MATSTEDLAVTAASRLPSPVTPATLAPGVLLLFVVGYAGADRVFGL